MGRDSDNSVIDIIKISSASEQHANSNLGITKEYSKENRQKLWDSQKGKADYKDNIFGDKETYIDPISGNVLHKSQKAAQNKYHMKNSNGENISTKWAEHSAETDHINSLKDVHDIVKHNPFLSDSDFKEIMNSDENYRILSKKQNTSKGEQNDWKIITDKSNGMSSESRVYMAKEKVKSDIALSSKFTVRTVENVGKEFAIGAKDTLVKSVIPLTAEAVRKLCKVANGDESLEDATREMGKVVIDVSVTGGTNKLLLDVVNTQLNNSKNAVFSKLANTNIAAQIITVAAVVKDSAVKYINGEIDEKEFINEVGVKGSTMVAGMIGGEIGGEIGAILGGIVGTVALPGVGSSIGIVSGKFIGQVLGTIITTVACSAIVSVYNASKQLNEYKLKENQIKRIELEALKEMENQRNILKILIKEKYEKWDEACERGFEAIFVSTFNNDIDGISSGINQILSIIGETVMFSSREEFNTFFDDEDAILEL